MLSRSRDSFHLMESSPQKLCIIGIVHKPWRISPDLFGLHKVVSNLKVVMMLCVSCCLLDSMFNRCFSIFKMQTFSVNITGVSSKNILNLIMNSLRSRGTGDWVNLNGLIIIVFLI